MSKNFELMQRAGRMLEIEVPVEPVTPPPAPRAEPPLVTSVISPRIEVWNNPTSARAHNADQLAREESHKLVQQVFLMQTHEPPRVVVFAGIDHGNGCSTICARTADSLQEITSGPICIVEANFRSPSLPKMYDTTNHFGLADALLSDEPIRSFAKPVRQDSLWLMSSGALTAGSHALLNSERLRNRFRELRNEFACVIVDAPPLNRYSDAITLAKLSDGLVLVIEANSTRREAAIRVSEYLHESQVRVLGAVLNKRTFPIPGALYRHL